MKTLMLVAWISGIGSDAATTHIAMSQGAREVMLSQRPLINDLVLGAEGAGGIVVLSRLYKTHPKLAVTIGIASGALRSAIAVHNLQAGRQSR